MPPAFACPARQSVLRFLVQGIAAAVLGLSLLPSAHADMAEWQKGANIRSEYPEDIASESFKESLRNLAATEATDVAFVIEYYQSNVFSTDLAPGPKTPTDEALIDAIDYAHSLGLRVTLKPHAESYDGQWRAMINPANRDAWFAAYGAMLLHYAELGEAHDVEQMVLGTELIHMSSEEVNATNTQHWRDMIADVREVFSGTLTYAAHQGTPIDEKSQVRFWDDLDFIGLDAYFDLALDKENPTVAELMASWEEWHDTVIEPMSEEWNKPVLFTEVGGRSVQGAHFEPDAWWRGGPVDLEEQRKLYEALFRYWHDKDFMKGVLLWEWTTNPNRGGPVDRDFTAEIKRAEEEMRGWFTHNGPPPPPPPCVAHGNGTFNACYFRNTALSGPALVRLGQTIDFNWGGSPPEAGFPQDNYSVRWMGNFAFETGNYEFTATADDGVRVFLGDELIIDQWKDQAATAYSVTRAMTAGTYPVKMEYYEKGGNAVAKLSWKKVVPPPPPPPPSPVPPPPPPPPPCGEPGVGTFTGCYYRGLTLTDLILTRTDATIDFLWHGGSPHPSVPQDNFSTRWQGVFPFEAKEYDFTARADDGVRIYIDGVILIDKWLDQAATTYTQRKLMTAGDHLVEMRYYERGGNAEARLSWTVASAPPPPPPSPTPAPPPPSPTPTPPPAPPASCGTPGTEAFTGCYHRGLTMSDLLLSRTDSSINFDWGGQSPHPSIPQDNFSVVWTGTLTFDASDYEFSVTGDDGVRLYVDGVLLIDKWIPQAPTTYTATKNLTAGPHLIRLEYFEQGGGATAKLSWKKIAPPPPPPPPPPPCGQTGTGSFTGCYYRGVTLSDLAFTRADTAIDFNWDNGTPQAGFPSDNFSVRWEKDVTFDAGTYEFRTTADDGVRVYVDGVLIIDKWIDQGATLYKATRTLTAGMHRVKMEYYERGGQAVARLGWVKL